MKSISVNEALDQIQSLNGRDITVRGVLRFEFECHALDHAPVSEHRDPPAGAHFVYGSSIWLEVGMGSLGFNEATLERWSGKEVVVQGSLFPPSPTMGGSGHFCGWPATLLARSIELP